MTEPEKEIHPSPVSKQNCIECKGNNILAPVDEGAISQELAEWKSAAKTLRMIILFGEFIALILSWYFLFSMAREAAARYSENDLVTPFVFAAGGLVLIYLANYFINTFTTIYQEEIERGNEYLETKWQGVKNRLFTR
jgi:uncharacterized membrane protein